MYHFLFTIVPFLFLLLLGAIFAYNCKNEHISVRIDGRYTNILKEACACPAGSIGYIDSLNKRCFCYLKTEIAACNNDKKCTTNLFAGCVNKNINDY